MGIHDLFSKRQRRSRGEFPDVFQYNDLPEPLRVQFVHILRDLFGDPGLDGSHTEEAFKYLHDVLCREYGRFKLSEKYHNTSPWSSAVFDFLLDTETETEQALSVIELAFHASVVFHEQYEFMRSSKPKLTPDDAAAELNHRFREHGVGYQLESNQIVRVDSQFLHAEAVKPVLTLLAQQRFEGANSEFLKAHEHYRHARYSESMSECLKAFESVLKVICTGQGWSFKETVTAKTLIDVAFTNHLLPAWLLSEFTALRSTLESGVPTIRNKRAGHGQGGKIRTVPLYLAKYVLHLTASSILFLTDAEEHIS
ncbi:MAG: hypothetical protein IH939_06525 [Acidobacteria bacterium]|nr:hypothetical protein [Acidobacteriota bacterium]